MHAQLLTDSQIEEFRLNGALILRNFYSIDSEILPIQRDIHAILGMMINWHGLPIEQEPFSPSTFDGSHQEIIGLDRKYGGYIYDAVKQLSTFRRLVSNLKNELIYKELSGADIAGISPGAQGIRIDNPGEEKYRSRWHQELLYQPQSYNGLVLWSPLVELTEDMGPVDICLKSHKDGLCVYHKSEEADHEKAYKIIIADSDNVIGKYERISPIIGAGDLLVMNFLTIHQSGINTSNRSRWTMQMRYFNFDDPLGLEFGWPPSVTTGTPIESIFPDNFQ
ncbi:MAG: phytanoyl-CoA dioxygenase family protein [bacterium]